jgi:hypothetical protein
LGYQFDTEPHCGLYLLILKLRVGATECQNIAKKQDHAETIRHFVMAAFLRADTFDSFKYLKRGIPWLVICEPCSSGWHGKHKWFQETYFGTLKMTKWFGECCDELACSLVYSPDVYGFLG